MDHITKGARDPDQEIAVTQQIDDTFLQTHILASLPKEYNSLVDAAKVDLRPGNLLMTELNKWLKELYTRQKIRTSGQMMRLLYTVQLIMPNKCPRKDLWVDAPSVEK